MISSADNPLQNRLIPGASMADIDAAIKKSGYPLQTIITKKLKPKFYCQEEWSFIDSQTNELRSLDIMAQVELYEFKEPQPRVRPCLNLLIECKQSDLPYVFFLSPNKLYTPNYPNISGLFQKTITVHTDDDPSTWIMSFNSAFDLEGDKFIRDSVSSSLTFSKCVRNGKSIALSGTDSYQGLVLPLLKALQHFEYIEAPSKAAQYFDAHLPFAIAVIDGPMIGVTVDENSHISEFLPWVRVFRHESYQNQDRHERQKLFAIDIVHRDYFETFLNQHLLPFANKYAELFLKHDKKIVSGKIFVKGMRENSWGDFEPRIEAYSITKQKKLKK